MKKLLLFTVLLLAACATDTSTRVEIKTVYVDRPAPCPVADEAYRLLTSRPVPLRTQEMPSTTVERVAKSLGQLGLYDSEGGWGDQVVAALKRCQVK